MSDIIKSFTRAFIVQDRWMLYLEGLGNTVIIASVAVLIGLVIGVLFAMINYLKKKTGKLKFLSALVNIYITVVRGTPVVLQLMILYFVVFATWDNGIMIGAITFGINSSAYVAEIVRAGFESVDDGQREAGRSLGLSTWQTMWHIIIPQAIKNSLPPLFNEFITLIKETAIVGYVGIIDLGKVPGMIQSRTFEYLPPLIISAAIYLGLVMLLTFALRKMEKALAKSDRNGGGKQ
ncbi:MAG: amino acid ABC transporter permease [Clostridia bacterium]|nr:amino acid ABC transporter permease [Clostridia bacterium]